MAGLGRGGRHPDCVREPLRQVVANYAYIDFRLRDGVHAGAGPGGRADVGGAHADARRAARAGGLPLVGRRARRRRATGAPPVRLAAAAHGRAAGAQPRLRLQRGLHQRAAGGAGGAAPLPQRVPDLLRVCGPPPGGGGDHGGVFVQCQQP